MPHYKYLIVGGGMTADAAAQGIRELDRDGAIGLLGAEPNAPYDRPPLSKGMWKGKPRDKVFRHTEDKNVTLHLDTRATNLDPANKRVTDQNNVEYTYDKLLLATGATPARLPFGQDQIIYFRTLRDYDRVRALSDENKTFVMIGGGYIGSEVAAALAMQGRKVTMISWKKPSTDRNFRMGWGNF